MHALLPLLFSVVSWNAEPGEGVGQTTSALPPSEVAARIDRALEQAARTAGLERRPSVDDATFLRRLLLDVSGTTPGRDEVESFLADESPGKRARKIQETLAAPEWAEHWARTYEELLLASSSRRQDGRRLEPYLEAAFAERTPFDQIVRTVLGSEGRSDEKDELGLLVAYREDREALASVTARTFLGVQIQCAQCHDSPDGRWLQSDFDGFTAFFQRARFRPAGEDAPRNTFEIHDLDASAARAEGLRRLIGLLRPPGAPGLAGGESDAEDASMQESTMQEGAMQDGTLEDETLQEASNSAANPEGDDLRSRRSARSPRDPRALPGRNSARNLRRNLEKGLDDAGFERLLARLPADVQERARTAREREQRFSTPCFLGGDALPAEVRTTRAALADWMVAPENPWFARATVNRVFAELFGVPLHEPLDDLESGQDRVPGLLEFLADQFVASGYSFPHLLECLARSETYALGLSLEEEVDRRQEEEHFAAHPLRPLGPEQILNALLTATQLDLRLGRRGVADPAIAERRLLQEFRTTFQDDEGGSVSGFEAGIPQALFLMNGRLTNDALTARASPVLQEIVSQFEGTKDRLEALFLATLGRRPSNEEVRALSRTLEGKRRESSDRWTDVYWALLNSTEFRTNH